VTESMAVVGALADFACVLVFDALAFRSVGAAHVDPRISEEVARVLSTGGWAAFAEPDPEVGKELAHSLEVVGFELVEVVEVGLETVVSGRLG